MGFLDKIGQELQKLAKPHPDSYKASGDLLQRFEPADTEELTANGEAQLSFIRQRSFRGNARNFRIMVDGREAAKIPLDSQLSLRVEPGIHQIYIKLDTLKSQILNVKAEAGKRYCFDIACTMEDGMIFRRVEE